MLVRRLANRSHTSAQRRGTAPGRQRLELVEQPCLRPVLVRKQDGLGGALLPRARVRILHGCMGGYILSRRHRGRPDRSCPPPPTHPSDRSYPPGSAASGAAPRPALPCTCHRCCLSAPGHTALHLVTLPCHVVQVAHVRPQHLPIKPGVLQEHLQPKQHAGAALGSGQP